MSQTLNASTLLAVPLAPLVGAALAGIFGTQFGGNWIGRRLTHSLTILGRIDCLHLVSVHFKKCGG
jgi:NADH-quinone oxidoreductase subunit L